MTQELITILIAMTPTLEAHGAIATAVGLFKFSPIKAFALASFGTVLITPLLLVFWKYLAAFAMRRSYHLNRFFTWLFGYTQRKHAHRFERREETPETPGSRTIDLWKAIALYVFVAVPGPFTGVWGGTVAAFVFGIPFPHSALALILGAVSVALIDALVIGGFLKLVF